MRPSTSLLVTVCTVAVFGLPAAAAAGLGADRNAAVATPAAQPDGTLIIRSASGVLTLSGRGSVIGQVLGKARLLIEDADPSDGVPVVSGYDKVQRQSRFAVLYIGSDLRFRVLGGQFKLRLVAGGISLSFVGRGTAALAPAGTPDDGSYSLDGGDSYRSFGPIAATMIVTGGLTGQPPLPSSLGPDRP